MAVRFEVDDQIPPPREFQRSAKSHHLRRINMKTPRGWLLIYSLLGFAVSAGIAYHAIRDQNMVNLLLSAGFLLLAILLWYQTRWALLANSLLGLFVILLGVYVYWDVGRLGMLIGGGCILASYWPFREELEKQTDAERTHHRDDDASSHGPGLCIALLRDGWKPYRFPHSNVVVAVPHDFVAAFDDDGVLLGTLDGRSQNFSATLHANEEFHADPAVAYDFLDDLAEKSNVEPTDKGTYRYFKDPNLTGDEQLQYTFYVIAIPGSVVVVSIASTPGRERPDPLARIENAIPDIVGELA
ncbi:hypothetical protein Rcae01_06737 [Novipirellula caenicola]|uniref:MraY-like glycosyltransferase n=2 Tax=Novipirellula caenicola TaxID=1536901 RepID=A0ABP9W2I7_9BACT